jgi:hypothetical protein
VHTCTICNFAREKEILPGAFFLKHPAISMAWKVRPPHSIQKQTNKRSATGPVQDAGSEQDDGYPTTATDNRPQ